MVYVTYNYLYNRVLNISNSSASKFVLPLFIPHLIVGVSFPITVGAALIELFLSRERLERIHSWTTTVVRYILSHTIQLSLLINDHKIF